MIRRKFIQISGLTAFSISTFGAINWNGKTFQGNTPTTTDILGPFYRPGSPLRTNLIPTSSKGEVLNLTGVVYKKDGVTPMSNPGLRGLAVRVHRQDLVWQKEFYYL